MRSDVLLVADLGWSSVQRAAHNHVVYSGDVTDTKGL
jgi:hypothetical protein